MTYKHGDWFCKPASEAEAREIIERAVASGAVNTMQYNGNTPRCDFYGVRNGVVHATDSGYGPECKPEYGPEYTIAELRQKFPLPGEQQQWNGEGLPPVGWHGECSSDKHGWFECVVLPDGFIAYTANDKWWQVDDGNGVALEFRPLRTERERFVIAAQKYFNEECSEVCPAESTLLGIYDALKSGELKAPVFEG